MRLRLPPRRTSVMMMSQQQVYGQLSRHRPPETPDRNRNKHCSASPPKLTSPAGFGVQHEMRDARCENRKQQRSISIQASARGPTRPVPRHDGPRKLFRFQIVSRRSDVDAQILSRPQCNNVTAHRACFASATIPSSEGQPSTWFKPQRQSASEMRHRQALAARQGRIRRRSLVLKWNDCQAMPFASTFVGHRTISSILGVLSLT
jgi:hypothetical protein